MEIASLFAKDINRPINGVVKVAQDDTESLRQELSEYVVTRELQRHFAEFLECYCAAIDTPTDKVGVWISGFFGSGKSHFLKMLSYLLSNSTVDGVPAVGYFDGKLADPLVDGRLRRAAGIPTEAILFNIDSKGGQWKEGAEARTALLRAFARVFYEHQGFYGEDLKLARLEQFIERQGKTGEFRAAFARVNGGDWLADRESYRFFEDDVTEALMEALGWSRENAQHWFDGTETDAVSPDKLTDEIRDYAEARAAENGGCFRLLFMVDEVGQFIGKDVDLMLNLQTIVEELGAKCSGRVWVMVTSQEAIDEVTKVAGNDFSKIQGRFNTRLSLSSSSVDEVIKRRVLEKTDVARQLLSAEYEEQSAVLKNLFTFEDSQSDLKGYANAIDFAESYPFAGYQFTIMPSILAEIRKHGNAGKHLSGGERSMLSGFQEAAQKIQDRPQTALVPLWRFYDTIASFLEHGIRQVIERATRAAEAGHGLMPSDVEVLKVLYLIRYVNDIKPTAANVAILMVDDLGVDKVSLREDVKASLDRLVRENYVARSGDRFSFLTDEEQDIARAIANTSYEAADVVGEVAKIIFEDIYRARKYRKGANDFPIDRYVDEQLYGAAQGGMRLNVVTMAHPDLADADDGALALRSSNQALVALAVDSRYYDVLEGVVKIRRYVRTQNVQQLPEGTQRIIADRQKEATAALEEARSLISDALVGARFAVDGQLVDVRATTAAQALEAALDELVSAVFTKAGYIDAPIEGQEDLTRVLMGGMQRSLKGTGGGNERALEEVERFLEVQERAHAATPMGDVQRKYQAKPYGWRELDVACVVAQLAADQKVTFRVAGAVKDISDAASRREVQSLLMGKGADGLEVRKRVLPSASLMGQARSLMRDFTGEPAVPEDADGLARAIVEVMEARRARTQALLEGPYDVRKYPGRAVVEEGLRLANTVLCVQGDDVALMKEFVGAEEALLDWSEDFELVEGFFPNQQRLFDEAWSLNELMEKEAAYLVSSREAQEALAKLEEVLVDEKPYERVRELPELGRVVQAAHGEAVRVRRNDLFDQMTLVLEEVRAYAEEGGAAALAPNVLSSVNEEFTDRKDKALNAVTCGDLDMLRAQLDTWRERCLADIDKALEADRLRNERTAAERARQEDIAPAQADAVSRGEEPSTPAVAPAARVDSRPARPAVRHLSQRELCPAKRLSSEEDVEAYVATIRKKLMSALDEAGVVAVR